jgi:hypothetical protein
VGLEPGGRGGDGGGGGREGVENMKSLYKHNEPLSHHVNTKKCLNDSLKDSLWCCDHLAGVNWHTPPTFQGVN